MSEVYLAVYDLSQGMARTLSTQFLGPNHALDMIPHTGILVFGKEYYFGGGIQATDPHSFRASTGMRPVQTVSLGRTNVTPQELNEWCQQNTKFTMTTYDLLYCNCNHFSHDCATLGLKLAQGVPDWILQVPQRFLSSPMGQMVRPMLEQMQLQATQPQQSSTSLQRQTPEPPPIVGNPWANLPTATSSSSVPAPKPTATRTAAIVPVSTKPSPPPAVLCQYSKPLLSKDVQTIKICVKKLGPYLVNDTAKQLLVLEQPQLQRVISSLSSSNNNTTLSLEEQSSILSEVWRLLKEEQPTTTSFTLMFLRLLVLLWLPGDDESNTQQQTKEECPQIQECLEWLIQEKFNAEESWKSPVERSLAWCVLSNHVAKLFQVKQQKQPSKHSLYDANDVVVDAAIRDLSSQVVSVRQAASAFLYNCVLLLSQSQSSSDNNEEEEDSISVSMLCACLESIDEETDATTRLRRLVVAGRIVYPIADIKDNSSTLACNDTAKSLVQDLGFVEVLERMAGETTTSSSKKEETHCQQLATELVYRLQGHS